MVVTKYHTLWVHYFYNCMAVDYRFTEKMRNVSQHR